MFYVILTFSHRALPRALHYWWSRSQGETKLSG